MRKLIAISLFSLGLAAPAWSLPGLTLEESAREVAEDECPVLTQIKYPWLRCTTNEWGGKSLSDPTVAANATWDSDRRIPIGHEWVEGTGAWFDIER